MVTEGTNTSPGESPSSSGDISLDEAGELVDSKPQKPSPKLSPDLVPLPHKQEETRSKLAAKLVNLSIGTVIGVFALIAYDKYLVANDKKTDSQASKELITLIWTSQVALVGTALGFYFGNQKAGKPDD